MRKLVLIAVGIIAFIVLIVAYFNQKSHIGPLDYPLTVRKERINLTVCDPHFDFDTPPYVIDNDKYPGGKEYIYLEAGNDSIKQVFNAMQSKLDSDTQSCFKLRGAFFTRYGISRDYAMISSRPDKAHVFMYEAILD